MRRTVQGFSLIELAVVMAIIAIIAVIAVPSYQAYVDRANREQVTTALSAAKTALLRYRMDNGNFSIPNSAALVPYGLELKDGKYGDTVSIAFDTIGPSTFTVSARHVKTPCHLLISFGSDEPRAGSDGCSGY